MSLFTIVIALLVVGLLLWLINTYLPIDPTILRIINIVVIVFVCIWLLKAFGLFAALSTIKI